MKDEMFWSFGPLSYLRVGRVWCVECAGCGVYGVGYAFMVFRREKRA